MMCQLGLAELWFPEFSLQHAASYSGLQGIFSKDLEDRGRQHHCVACTHKPSPSYSNTNLGAARTRFCRCNESPYSIDFNLITREILGWPDLINSKTFLKESLGLP